MCGILAYQGPERNISEFIFSGLKSLEYRGYDSWGIVAAHEGQSYNVREVGKLGDNPPESFSAKSAIGHTRWATTGAVNAFNAHPHVDCRATIAVAHNGIVENYEKLKRQLLKSGHRFTSETDTEVIAHLVEEELKQTGTSLIDAVRRVGVKLEGLNAFVVLQLSDGEIAAAKTGSPLYIGISDGVSMIASDVNAFLGEAKQYIRVGDRQAVSIRKQEIELYDTLSGVRIQPIIQDIGWSVEDASLGSHRHYLIKEVNEQPAIIRRIASEDVERRVAIEGLIENAREVWLTGCGTAYHAALFATYLWCDKNLWCDKKVRTRAIFANELEHFIKGATSQDVVIALSQSGETIDLLEVIRKLRTIGVPSGAIVNVPNSTLTYEVDCTLLLGAGPERCVLSTKAFTSTLAYLYLIANKDKVAQASIDLKDTACEMERLLGVEHRSKISNLATRLSHANSMFLVGSGELYPLALEAALKIKEVSYIHAEGFAAGELKHGVIALIEKGTPCVVFVPPGEQGARALIAAQEMKSRGAFVIGVSAGSNISYDAHIEVRGEGIQYALGALVPMQLLAYELALVRKLDPDKPRNLAKSVTVR